MKNIFRIAILSAVLFCSCKSKPASLSDQLKTNFLTHLNKMDSSIVLDSFNVLRIDTLNQRLINSIEDTMYRIILARVKSQMESATKKNNADSMAFYQSELDYMIPTSDSMRNLIPTSDTTKKYGIVAVCEVRVSKRNIQKTDKMYYFLSRNMTILNSEFIDSSISRISKNLN
jgi:hypothetical protein